MFIIMHPKAKDPAVSFMKIPTEFSVSASSSGSKAGIADLSTVSTSTAYAPSIVVKNTFKITYTLR